MVATDAEADLAVHLKAAARSEEAEGGRAKGVGWREYDATMVDPGGVCRGRWAAECEMPGKEVRFCRDGVEVRGGC